MSYPRFVTICIVVIGAHNRMLVHIVIIHLRVKQKGYLVHILSVDYLWSTFYIPCLQSIDNGDCPLTDVYSAVCVVGSGSRRH